MGIGVEVADIKVPVIVKQSLGNESPSPAGAVYREKTLADGARRLWYKSHMASQPPPLPNRTEGSAAPQSVQPLQYHTAAPADPSKRVFDRVAGPNLRLKDNLIQFACVIVGSAAGAYFGSRLPVANGLAFGLIGGLLLSVLVSGLVIGLIRFFGARHR